MADHPPQGDEEEPFELITAMSYDASLSENERFHLLPLHLARLRDAHRALAEELPESWCARCECPTEDQMVKVLEEAVRGKDGLQRVRLVVDEEGQPQAESFPLTPMPDYPVKLVLNSEATEYDSPFLRYKTSRRKVYDSARATQGATLHPSSDRTSPPFDVLLFNSLSQLTETTIANIAFKLSPLSKTYITPPQGCGLLPGMARRDLLERGVVVEGVVTVEEVQKAAREGVLEVICFNAVRGIYKATVDL